MIFIIIIISSSSTQSSLSSCIIIIIFIIRILTISLTKQVNVRILLLALWSASALICVPPLNQWGAYRRYEGTCWLAWLPNEGGYMAYDVIVTLLPLLVVVFCCGKGFTAVKKVKKIAATPANVSILCSFLSFY